MQATIQDIQLMSKHRASASYFEILRPLLQLRQNTSVSAQGCADFPSDSSGRNDSFTSGPGRASPSLRAGLSFRYTQAIFGALSLHPKIPFPAAGIEPEVRPQLPPAIPTFGAP
jgi:hypothetical protein